MPAAVWIGGLAAVMTSLTLLATLRFATWIEGGAGVAGAFAAGALPTATLLHLLPEAYGATPDAALWVFAGFAGAWLLNRGVLALAREPEPDSVHAALMGPGVQGDGGTGRLAADRGTALVAAVGIALHSLVDGLNYAVTFAYDVGTGSITAVGLVLHEAPEALVVLALLRSAAVPLSRAIGITFLAAGLTTPLGAALGVYLLPPEGPVIGVLLAVAAGVLLFVGAAHLLPHVEREPARRALPALILGGLVVFLGVRVAAAGIDHEGAGHAPSVAFAEREVPKPVPAAGRHAEGSRDGGSESAY